MFEDEYDTGRSDKRSNYIYDPRGNLIEAQYPFQADESAIIRYEYDQFDRLLRLIDAEEQPYTYNYRQDGQLNSITSPDDDELLLSYNTSNTL